MEKLGGWIEGEVEGEGEGEASVGGLLLTQSGRVNLRVLATVADVAQLADGELRDRLDEVVRSQVEEMGKQLPEGVKIGMKH